MVVAEVVIALVRVSVVIVAGGGEELTTGRREEEEEWVEEALQLLTDECLISLFHGVA